MTKASVFRLDGRRLRRDTQDRGCRAATNGQDTSGASSLEQKIAASSICILMCPPGGGPQNSHCGSILPSCSCSMRVRTRNTAKDALRPQAACEQTDLGKRPERGGKTCKVLYLQRFNFATSLGKICLSFHVAANLQSFNEDHRTVDEDQTRPDQKRHLR